MPAKTNTEQIQEISKDLYEFIATTKMQLLEFRRTFAAQAEKLDKSNAALQSALQTIAVLEARIVHLEQRAQETPSSRIAVVEQRCGQLEQQSDRRWQVWLAIFGSLLAMLVAILRK